MTRLAVAATACGRRPDRSQGTAAESVVTAHRRRPLCLLSLAWLMLAAISGEAATFFVSPWGDDGSAGTQTAPWKSLAKANQALRPGDTVVLLPGVYEGVIQPSHSGSKGAPIIYRAESRRGARLVGREVHRGMASTIHLVDVAYVVVRGMHVVPRSPDGTWLHARRTSHITIEDCLMEGATGGVPFDVRSSEEFYLRESVLRGYSGRSGNMAMFRNSRGIVLEGNAISRAGHCPLLFYPAMTVRDVVIRGNVFHGEWGRNFALFGVDNALLEHNIITNAYDGGRSADTRSKFLVSDGIFRFNRVFRNDGIPVCGVPNKDGFIFSNVRLYNNVFHDNKGPGFYISGDPLRTQDVVFQNNIFFKNDPFGSNAQVRITAWKQRGIRFVNNTFSSGDDNDHGKISLERVNGLYPVIGFAFAEQRYPTRFVGNLSVSPGFRDPAQYDYALKATSPLRDRGAPLAHAVGSGEGDLLPITDATGFYDGYGIDGEMGDWVAVGQGQPRARVVKVDRARQRLTLDRRIVWKHGDPVSVPWSGAAPEIGVYEEDESSHSTLHVEVEPSVVKPGQPVKLKVLGGGAAGDTFFWHLGDGTTYEGTSLTKTYHELSDYPIRVRVTDRAGERSYGVGYVRVEEGGRAGTPLVRTTFDDDDREWWWRWRAYRPTPAAYEQTPEPGPGKRSLHVYAPEDGGPLPASIHPRSWDIDRYPAVSLRYRIVAGTPLAMWLQGYETTISRMRLCVARTAEANVKVAERLNDYLLVDDGQWHDLELDVRIVRRRFPRVVRLRGLQFAAPDMNQVKRGQGYWIDDFQIIEDRSSREAAAAGNPGAGP